MPLQFQTNHRLAVYGMSGSGKTYWVKKDLIPAIQANAYTVIYDVEYEYSGFGRCVHSLAEFKQAVKTCKHVVYQPQNTRIQADFDPVCKFIVDHLRDIVIIVDEAHLLAKNKMPFNYGIIQKRGRKMHIGSVAISQRSQDTHKDILTQAQHVMIFKVTTKDMEHLCAYVGSGLRQLEQMPQYSCSYYSATTGKLEFEGPC